MLPLQPLPFFLSFGVGLILVYLFRPQPEIVYKFPNPQNAEKVQYHSDNDACYSFKATKETCPMDKSKIKPQPLTQ